MTYLSTIGTECTIKGANALGGSDWPAFLIQ